MYFGNFWARCAVNSDLSWSDHSRVSLSLTNATHQLPKSSRGLGNGRHNFAHSSMFEQDKLNLAQFNAKPIDLDLGIEATHVAEGVSIHNPTNQVAGRIRTDGDVSAKLNELEALSPELFVKLTVPPVTQG
eukprot:m.922898 g.922898  ORF g.922898 m.922898 type:complete len:131 (-) comp103972_c0_seq1:889-1281(-)